MFVQQRGLLPLCNLETITPEAACFFFVSKHHGKTGNGDVGEPGGCVSNLLPKKITLVHNNTFALFWLR